MIPLFKPFIPDKITKGLEEILNSGKLSYGVHSRDFEFSLKSFIGCSNILTTNSYGMAMQVLLTALDLKPGEEVIASPVACLASNQPLITMGLKVVWGDIDPKTGTLCPNSVKKKITKKTKAIFHNHFCGYLGYIEEINHLGKDHGIPVIDDAIEGFGSELNQARVGNIGTDITIFSFQTVRLPNTIDGGALVINNPILHQKALLVRDYGIDRTNFRDVNGEINPNCDILLKGYGGLMNEVTSFIGKCQMQNVPQLIEKQRENSKFWEEKINDSVDLTPLKVIKKTLPNYWVYGILSKNKIQTIENFRKEGYYASGVHFNNNNYSVFKNNEDLIGVNEFMKSFVAVPSGWWV